MIRAGRGGLALPLGWGLTILKLPTGGAARQAVRSPLNRGMSRTCSDPAPMSSPIYALAKAMVRALKPGNGRRSRCETEDELRSRLSEDGVIYDSSELGVTLSLLENNGEGGYDTGSLPGLPYVLLRPIPDAWPGPSRWEPHPARPLVLKRAAVLKDPRPGSLQARPGPPL